MYLFVFLLSNFFLLAVSQLDINEKNESSKQECPIFDPLRISPLDKQADYNDVMKDLSHVPNLTEQWLEHKKAIADPSLKNIKASLLVVLLHKLKSQHEHVFAKDSMQVLKPWAIEALNKLMSSNNNQPEKPVDLKKCQIFHGSWEIMSASEKKDQDVGTKLAEMGPCLKLVLEKGDNLSNLGMSQEDTNILNQAKQMEKVDNSNGRLKRSPSNDDLIDHLNGLSRRILKAAKSNRSRSVFVGGDCCSEADIIFIVILVVVVVVIGVGWITCMCKRSRNN
uniref:Uncharacterized protein n=1 Tax=Ditylenchus dipsaci TaxID=166011 RepID=A0A915D4D6_9BILA